jgi:DNA-binding MarR family transcriptional regulator
MYCTQCIENVGYFCRKADKLLPKNEKLFLSRLIFWTEHPKRYGIRKNGRVWIYNTLDEWGEQLKISKSTVRRVISSLKKQGLIDSQYLSANKRDRTLFYAVNKEKLRTFLTSEKSCVCAQESTPSGHINEHMDEHMYLTVNSKQKINKSYKSENFDEEAQNLQTSVDTSKLSAIQDPPNPSPKPTIVQDMIKIWQEEFPLSEFTLTKKLAQYLVKAFQSKFDSSSDEWRKYLKLIKTSPYITSEKFKINLFWVLKFTTIDRLKAGELGVDADKIPVSKSQFLKESKTKAQEHINSLKESEKCKEFRRKIIDRYGSTAYNSWFTKASLTEEEGKMMMLCSNNFERDWIKNYYRDIFSEEVQMKELYHKEQDQPHTMPSEEHGEILQKADLRVCDTGVKDARLMEDNSELTVRHPKVFPVNCMETDCGLSELRNYNENSRFKTNLHQRCKETQELPIVSFSKSKKYEPACL